jgi:DNA-binding response OmpR family regulator
MDSLLVISDDPALGETLADELTGIAVVSARAKEAAALVQKEKFRLILIDNGLGNDSEPGTLPAATKVPVIRLVRPARLSDLLYTIRGRLQSKTAPAREEVAVGTGFRLSAGERLLRSEDSAVRISLTEKEVELLLCLLEQGGKPVPREALLKRVWGYSDDIATHTLETHIYRLRGKLKQANESFDIVFSEEGGYRLAA